MRAVDRRIARLEHQLEGAAGKGILVVVSSVGLHLDEDTCVAILSECGFLNRGVCIVDLDRVPDGLNAQETETFLRKRGAEICSSGNARKV